MHSRVLTIAIPMILSNVSTPLAGMVDTAMMGHQQSSVYLAAAALGAAIVSALYWFCGFIRMSVTGLTAQAYGRSDETEQSQLLFEYLLYSLVLAVLLIVSQPLISNWFIFGSDASVEVKTLGATYFAIRMFGSPFALINIALIGWLIGRQKTRTVMLAVVIGNIVNVIFNLIFVLTLEMNIAGIAWATVISEAVQTGILLFGLISSGDWFKVTLQQVMSHINLQRLKSQVGANANILIRSLALQSCILAIPLYGAHIGETTIAVNAILMNFFIIMALGLDGFAHAAEALVGEIYGQSGFEKLKQSLNVTLIWSGALAVLYSIAFAIFFESLLSLMTDLSEVRHHALNYSYYLVALPLLGHWCFWLDGVFVGLSDTKAMRNTMVLACLLVFFPGLWLLSSLGNHGLWVTFLAFLAARGLGLGVILRSKLVEKL